MFFATDCWILTICLVEVVKQRQRAQQSELRIRASSATPPSTALLRKSIHPPVWLTTVCHEASSRGPALWSPALILQINKPCAERCSRPGYFQPSPLRSPFPGPKCLCKKCPPPPPHTHTLLPLRPGQIERAWAALLIRLETSWSHSDAGQLPSLNSRRGETSGLEEEQICVLFWKWTELRHWKDWLGR